MNKNAETNTQSEGKRLFPSGKLKEILLLAVLALVLIFAVWKIFYDGDETTSVSEATLTESEEKISRLLREIDGVGDAEVMIYETEEGVQGAVVVCEGANDFQVVINVREAVAAALGTEEKSVKIYLKKG